MTRESVIALVEHVHSLVSNTAVGSTDSLTGPLQLGLTGIKLAQRILNFLQRSRPFPPFFFSFSSSHFSIWWACLSHCLSLRHLVTPPHESTPPDVVVVLVDVVVDINSVVVVVGSTSSPMSPMTVVANVSTITRNSSHLPWCRAWCGSTRSMATPWSHLHQTFESRRSSQSVVGLRPPTAACWRPRGSSTLARVGPLLHSNFARTVLAICWSSVLFCYVMFCSVLSCSVLFCSVLWHQTKQWPTSAPLPAAAAI